MLINLVGDGGQKKHFAHPTKELQYKYRRCFVVVSLFREWSGADFPKLPKNVNKSRRGWWAKKNTLPTLQKNVFGLNLMALVMRVGVKKTARMSIKVPSIFLKMPTSLLFELMAWHRRLTSAKGEFF